MAKLVLSLGLVVILHLAALAQVDTLALQPVLNIRVPENIYDVFAANIRNDSSTEMIIWGVHHIYICDGINGNLLWTSPTLSYAQDFTFLDMNSDGNLDIAFNTNRSIEIYDIVNSNLIWSTEMVGCYALGDINSDGYPDIVTVAKNLDTAFVKIYNGPDYYLGNDFFIIMPEGLQKISIARLSGSQGTAERILLFSHSSHQDFSYDDPWYYNHVVEWGGIKILDPITMDVTAIDNIGYLKFFSVEQADSISTLYAICEKSEFQQSNFLPNFYYLDDYYIKASADTLLISSHIWSTRNAVACYWDGPIVGEFNSDNPGRELCYEFVNNYVGAIDSLRFYIWPEMTVLSQREMPHSIGVLGIFHTNHLSGPQVITKHPVMTFDGISGYQTSIISTPDQMRMVADLNNDGEDELINYSGTDVYIYRAINSPEGINDGNRPLPSSSRLYPAYPNPFNASTTIQYDLVKVSSVNIGIYDILGQRIATLVNQKQSAGHHQVIWNAKDVASGIYFYKIQAGNFSETKKMVLLK